MEKEVWRGGNMLNPLPAVIATCGSYEKPGDEAECNAITIGWTGTACSDPPTTYISIRPSRYSYQVIRESGEFVINLVTEPLCRAADLCGVISGRDVNKFTKAGLHCARASAVKAPLLDESPVNLECRVLQILPLGSHDMFLAEIAAVDVAKELLDDKGRFRLEDARLIAYMHGTYFKLGDEIGRFGFSVRKK